MKIKLLLAALLLPLALGAQQVDTTMYYDQIPELVFTGKATKEKYLLRKGVAVLAGQALGGFIYQDGKLSSMEFGSTASTGKPFRVQEISFTVVSNGIPGCKGRIGIYRLEKETKIYRNVLRKPLLVDIPVRESANEIVIRPEETIDLEPGRYFIAFSIERYSPDISEDTPGLYFKFYHHDGYYREPPAVKLKYLPVSIGIRVKGLSI